MGDEPQVPEARVETMDGTILTVAMASFHQVIRNPDGSEGQPVPMEHGELLIETAAGTTPVRHDEVVVMERVDDSIRIQTSGRSRIVGNIVSTAISRVVITGFAGNQPVVIPIDDVVRFERGDA